MIQMLDDFPFVRSFPDFQRNDKIELLDLFKF